MLTRLQGFNLIELLITMAVSTALLTGIISFVTQLLVSQRHIAADLVLENELSLVEHILNNEIRRAGFSESAIAHFVAKLPSPFAPSVTVVPTTEGSTADCILFSYDKNRNGKLDIDAPDERYGFKLHKQAIEIRRDGAACEKGGWHDLTDPRTIKITDFTINEFSTSNNQRFLSIFIKANHAHFAHIVREKKLYIKIEND